MIKRPLCAAALFWAALLWLLSGTGLPFFSCRPPRLEADVGEAEVLVTGVLYKQEHYDNISYFYLKNANLYFDSQLYPIDNVRLSLKQENLKHSPFPGDVMAAKGVLQQIPLPGNPGQFNPRSYYYARKVKWYQKGSEGWVQEKRKDPVLALQGRIKESLEKGIEKAFGEQKGAIVKAMLVGEKGDLREEDRLMYQMLGISHILAISGLHLSVLGWGLFRLLGKLGLPVKVRSVCTLAAMFFYGSLTGGGAAVMRAAVMFGAGSGALAVKRTYDFLSAVSLASILLLAESPLYLYDSSFLLSFGAILGLALVAPALPLSKGKEGSLGQKSLVKRLLEKLREGIRSGLLSGISVWAVLLPVNMYFFYEIPVLGLLTNLAVLPTAGLLLVSGFLAGAGGMFLPAFAARGLALPAEFILELYETMGKAVGGLPFSLFITGQPRLWQCVLYYVFLGAILFLQKKVGQGKIWVPFMLGAGIFLLFFSPDRGKLQAAFLDVGQGDCACVWERGSFCYLIDGGSSTVHEVGKYRILPFLKAMGIQEVDGIFLSHMDQDHTNGIVQLLEMIERRETVLKVRCLFLTHCRETEEEIRQIAALGRRAGCQVIFIEKGSKIKDKEMEITCLSPGREDLESNAGSQVLHIKVNALDMLFTGDTEDRGEKELTEILNQEGQAYEILKVAHHGSKNSTSQEFLDAAEPGAAVISCGQNNLYGHPHQELLQRLEKMEIPVFSTKEGGAVLLRWDGENAYMSFHCPEIMVK